MDKIGDEKMFHDHRNRANNLFQRVQGCMEAAMETEESPLHHLYDWREINEDENRCYWYHTDHLGSSSWITYTDGTPVQHLHYLSWGEDLVRQRHTNYHARYTFSGKEKDMETGYSYFGSRYYSSDLSIWLSVDPMAHKYPSFSPYVYCANNPIKLVDPNGEEIVIVGNDASEALKQLNSSTNLTLEFGSDGKTVRIVGGKAKNRADRLIQKAIADNDIVVNIEAKKENSFEWHDGKILPTEGGGGYGGNNVVEGVVNTYQKVVPSMLDDRDRLVDGESSGKYMLHEVAESYIGGKIAKRTGISSPRAGLVNSTYDRAHKKANKIAGGEFIMYNNYETIRNSHGEPIINPQTGKVMLKFLGTTYSRY